MRERKGLGAPVPDAAPGPSASPASVRRPGMAVAVPEQGGGPLVLSRGLDHWPLTSTRVLIGRVGGDVGAHVELSDDTVSRRHAELLAVAGGWEVRDLGSTNGTWVGAVRLASGEPAAVGEGATLRFGSAEVRVVRR